MKSTQSILALSGVLLLAACSGSSPEAVQQTDTPTTPPVNTSPQLSNDSFTVMAGSSNNSFTVLSNDTCNCTMTVDAVADPDGAGGSSTLTNGTTVSYTPDNSFTGGETQTFSYTVTNEFNQSAQATITVTIADGVTAADDMFSVSAGSSNNDFDVLANDAPQGDISIQSVTDPDGDNMGSSVSINAGQIRYTPDSSFDGGEVQTFEYTIMDGDGATSTATVSVSITAVLAATDDSFSITAGSSNNLLDVLSNDTPEDGLTIISVTDPDDGGASTTSISNGQISYTPDSALADGAMQTFTYTVEDSQMQQATATVSITIVTGPSASDDSLTINKNSPHNAIDVLANDSASVPANKAISTFDAVTAQGGRVFLHADGLQLVYQPPRNVPSQMTPQGSDSFNYTMTDGSLTSSATVNITINQFINIQQRPCELEAQARMDAGRPYCFDVAIPALTADGHVIHATVFVPADEGASQPPVMLHAHGFGESRFASMENPNSFMVNRVTAQALLDMWHEGYWVVSYDQRGFNASGLWGPTAESSNGTCMTISNPECVDVMSPEREGRDMVAVTDWIVANLRSGFSVTVGGDGNTTFNASAEANPTPLFAEDSADDPVMGTIGLSYGGGFQTVGTAVENARDGRTRINAMVPVTTWFDIRYSLFPNDVPKTGWLQFLSAATATGGTTIAADGLLAQVGQEALVLDNVSTSSYDRLFLRTPRAYCEGLGDGNIDGMPLEPQATGDGSATQIPNVPGVFFIQGQRDILFNYNEALDLAKCYEAAGSPDVRLLIQTDGHILQPAQQASYRGATEVIYVDEKIYCDEAGATELDTSNLIAGWLRTLLPPPAVPERFMGMNQLPPKVCTTHFLPGAAPQTGNTFASFADVPVGGSLTVNLDSNAALPGDQAVSFTLPGAGPNNPLFEQTVFTASADTVISGVPTLSLTVTGSGTPAPGDDVRFFATMGVKRGGGAVDRLADQITPISGAAPTAGPNCLPACPVSFTYPRTDAHYPEQVGETVGTIGGFAVQLNAGDELVLQFFDQDAVFNLHGTNPGGYTLSVSGSVSVPVLGP